MPQYKFTEQAEHDLGGIIDFTILQWGQSQALKYVDGLEELLGSLAGSPVLGTKKDELYKGLLSFPYVSHVLFYVENADGITVIRILHKRMDSKKQLSGM